MVKLKDTGMYRASREMLLKFAKEHSGTGFDQEAFYQIGLCYKAEEDLDKAIEYLKKAGNHQPAQAEIKKLYLLEEAKKLSQVTKTARQARQENVRESKEKSEREFDEDLRKEEIQRRTLEREISSDFKKLQKAYQEERSGRVYRADTWEERNEKWEQRWNRKLEYEKNRIDQLIEKWEKKYKRDRRLYRLQEISEKTYLYYYH